MTNKHSFMQERGISDKNSSQYKEAEREYNRLYHKKWREKNLGNNYVIIKIMLHINHYKLILKIANFLNLPVATLIKQVVLAWCRKSFFLPPNEWLKKAIQAINAVGNLINQQTRHIHTIRQLTEKDYQFLLNQIASIRDKLNQIFSQPIPLKTFLQEALEKDEKTTRREIQEVLNEFKHDNKNNIT
jgi:hypothetical protein